MLYDSVTSGVNAKNIILAKKLKNDRATTKNLSSKYHITAKLKADNSSPIKTILTLPHRGSSIKKNTKKTAGISLAIVQKRSSRFFYSLSKINGTIKYMPAKTKKNKIAIIQARQVIGRF